MREHSSTETSAATRLALCITLWLIALALAGYGIWWLMQPNGFWPGTQSLLAALLTLAAGIGLYRLRRWGVILFGVLSLTASIFHIASAFQRFASLTSAPLAAAVGAIISVLGAFLIPFVLIYLLLILWRQAR